MSRAYRIRISETVERVVHVEDGVATTLELLPILPKERMSELLASALVGVGMIVEAGVAKRVDLSAQGEVTVAVELATGIVTVTVAKAEDVQVEGVAQRVLPERASVAHDAKIRDDLKRAAVALAEGEVARVTEDVRRAATEHLEGRLRDVRAELDRIVHGVTAAALKERASQIGEIEEIEEDAEAGTLTIKVKV